MELKDIPVLNTRNIGINFFGSLVVPQDAVMELNRYPIADIKVYEGLMYSRICHGFNDVLVINLKELVKLYVCLRANKNEVIQVLGYLIDRGVVYERPGVEAIRYSELWNGSPVGAYIASALYEQERYKIFGPEVEKVKGESEEGTEEKNIKKTNVDEGSICEKCGFKVPLKYLSCPFCKELDKNNCWRILND